MSRRRGDTAGYIVVGLFALTLILMVAKWLLITAAIVLPCYLLARGVEYVHRRRRARKTADAQVAAAEQRQALDAERVVADWSPPTWLEQRYDRIMGWRRREP